MRLALRVLLIVAALLVYVPLHYLWRMFGRVSPWPPRFLGFAGWAAGARVRIVGMPLKSHVLFAANHLSWLDILLVGGAAGAAFVSKDEVARWPVIGWLAGLNRTIFVARAERRSVRGQAGALREALAQGRPVALFPEGTTDGGRALLPFRPSLFAALDPPLPDVKVQPIAIDYGDVAAEIEWVGEEPAAANARRLLSRKGSFPVTLTFLDPIDPALAGGRKALAAAAERQVAAALGASAASPLTL